MRLDKVTDEYKLLLTRIGEIISQARSERGLTQRDLARISKKNQTVIAKVEKFPSPDTSLRNIYEITSHIPVALSEVFARAERDLNLFRTLREPNKVEERMAGVIEKLEELPAEEQAWLAGIIEGLLDRTSSPLKLTDNTDKRLQTAVAQPS